MRSTLMLVFGGLIAAGCGSARPLQPSPSAVVTLAVEQETFRVLLTEQQQIDAAVRARSGSSSQFPIGRIAAGTEVNRGWSWHLVDVNFVDVATEVCDGRPSDVERQGLTFGTGRFCPWLAKVVAVEML